MVKIISWVLINTMYCYNQVQRRLRILRKNREIYERRYREGYNIYDPQYYIWLKSTHPSYAEEWYYKVAMMMRSSSQITPSPSDPSTELEQTAMLDSSRSSIEVELAGEGNKDLEKYTRRYEEGYNIL